ncbi:glycoside hydrolase family 26 protein [Microbulbifer agarilyticus]
MVGTSKKRRNLLFATAISAAAMAIGIGASVGVSSGAWALMEKPAAAAEQESYSRYEPLDDKVLVVAGQTLAATRAYYQLAEKELVPRPAGFTDYISYQVGNKYPKFAPGYPQSYQGNDGLLNATNWGGGEQCTDCLLHEPGYEEAVIAIGMYIGGPLGEKGEVCTAKDHCNTARIANGDLDHLLRDFAGWLNQLGERPVLLRIGYEFDGSWNGYDPQQYQAAFKYIRRFLEKQDVDNVAYVLQSFGYASYETMQNFYPEADQDGPYVDWIGYSYFTNTNATVGKQELRFARERGHKVFIAEVTPHTGDCAKQIDVVKAPAQAKQWIETFDQHVRENRDVVRAISYINARWNDSEYSPMWSQQMDHNCPGYFANSNARLNDNLDVAEFWGEKMAAPMYLNGEANLYSKLRK